MHKKDEAVGSAKCLEHSKFQMVYTYEKPGWFWTTIESMLQKYSISYSLMSHSVMNICHSHSVMNTCHSIRLDNNV